MGLQAITLMEAYIIENLRKNGVSNEELLHMDEQSLSNWKMFEDRFDYTILKKLAKQRGDQFSSIINEGYTVKFLTLNGLINLIQLKLGKNRDVDFAVHKDGISKLVVDNNDLDEVRKILSPNWKVTEKRDGLSIRSVFDNALDEERKKYSISIPNKKN